MLCLFVGAGEDKMSEGWLAQGDSAGGAGQGAVSRGSVLPLPEGDLLSPAHAVEV